MSGWQIPPGAGPGAPAPSTGGADGPVVGWEPPSEVDGLGIGECVREGWRITRAQLGTLAAITAIPTLLINILYIPLWLTIATTLDGMFRFWAELDWSRYQTDPAGVERDMLAAMRPFQELSLATSAATGLIVAISVVTLAAVTAGTLAAAAGHRPSIGGVFGAALRQRAVVVPAVVLGIGYTAVFLPLTLIQPGLAYTDDLPARTGASIVFGLLTLVIEAVVIYLAVRWAFYFQVVMAEGVGIRAGMSRSAALSAGIRLRIALVVIVVTVVLGLVVSMIVMVPAIVVGLAMWSIVAAVITSTVVFSVTAIVYIPFFVAMLTYMYDRRLPGAASA